MKVPQLIIVFLLISVSSVLTFFLLKWFIRLVNEYSSLRSRISVANRWSSNWKPNIGGTAFIILYLTSQLYLIIIHNEQVSSSIISGMIAITLGYLLGLMDDLLKIKPYIKLLFQSACSTILILGGVYINYFDNQVADFLLTYIWIIGIMNSINMLDNMDGITAGVSLAILLWTILFITSIHSTYFIDYYSLYVISGTMIGFLMLNFYPAKIFMGDKGSQFIGIYLSYISIQYFWNIGHLTNNYSDWFRQGLVPLLIFLVPILDTTFVTINRLSRGTSPAVGGKDHTTHHWFYFGLSQRQIAIFYFLLTCLSGLFAYFLAFLSYSNQTLYSMFGTMYVVLIVLIFLWGYQSGAKKLKHQ